MCIWEEALPGPHFSWLIFRSGERIAREGNTRSHPGVPLGAWNLLYLCFCHCMFFLTSPRPALHMHKELGKALHGRSSVCFCSYNDSKGLLLALKMYLHCTVWDSVSFKAEEHTEVCAGTSALQSWNHWGSLGFHSKSLQTPRNVPICISHWALPLQTLENWSRTLGYFCACNSFSPKHEPGSHTWVSLLSSGPQDKYHWLSVWCMCHANSKLVWHQNEASGPRRAPVSLSGTAGNSSDNPPLT